MRADGKREGLRQSMAWLHTWSGLLLGWLLYAIFFTGTLSYFRDEIDTWMRPELQVSQPSAQSAELALARMAQLAPGAARWTLRLPDDRRLTVDARWDMPGASRGRARAQQVELDAGTGEVLHPRQTAGADFLYRFHFSLYAVPRTWGRWIVGAATLVMLVAILSGLITHRRIFSDFFTFRPRKGPRSWLDAHNALAVLALPFHIVITFSGLLLLMPALMPWGADAVFKAGNQRFKSELFNGGQSSEKNGEQVTSHARDAAPLPIEPAPIAPMLLAAKAAWPQQGIGTIVVTDPGTSRAVIELREREALSLTTFGSVRRLNFDGTTGKPLDVAPTSTTSAALAFYNVMNGTHQGRAADPAVRLLLFLSGILGTAMAGTGLVLYVAKRQAQRRKASRPSFFHGFVEVANVGTIAGLSASTAAYFWGNRLLPVDLPARSSTEIHVFFTVWAACLMYAAVRPHQRAWRDVMAFASLLLLLLPVLNGVTGGVPLPISIARGQWSLAGFDLAMLVLGALHGVIAWTVHRAERRPDDTKSHQIRAVT